MMFASSNLRNYPSPAPVEKALANEINGMSRFPIGTLPSSAPSGYPPFSSENLPNPAKEAP